MPSPRTILVSGALANKCAQGGEAWIRLSWVLGLRKLGFEVLFVEQLDDPSHTAAIDYFLQVTARFGLATSSSLITSDGQVLAGSNHSRILAFAETAEALINISGHLTYAPILDKVRPRIYLDIDPGFTQFWHATGIGGARLENHDFYFTIGQNIGSPDCSIPTCGLSWLHTRPPVVLDYWPSIPAPGPADDRIRFSTVANWRGSFGSVEFGGKTYGLKVHEFRKVFELPQRSGQSFEIALQIYPGDRKDLDALRQNAWHIVDPKPLTDSPESFQQYIQDSGAEFSVAQGIYIDTNSGWFSDRTAHYLASGKPALVQDTGFSRHIPTGDGLVAFRSLDEAVDASKRIAANYQHHRRAARAIAEEHFDSNKVIARLFKEASLI